MKKKLEIPAIHEKDLDDILNELGVLKEINDLNIHCYNCYELINRENIGGLKLENDNCLIICDNPECLASETIKGLKQNE